MERDRLGSALAGVHDRRMALIVAPAGAGKSTLLAQFFGASRDPVAWYRAEASEARPADLLARLEGAFTTALGEVPGDWSSVVGAARALDARVTGRAYLVVDDLHLLSGTPAEAALEQLWHYAPPGLALVVAARVPPGFDLLRLRLEDELIELGADDLRFRAWEVERLYRDHYGERLSPEEIAHLTRRTQGWAAGLALFHLATRGKPPAERRRLLRQLGGRSQLVREYLTRNVLDDLPSELRVFLLHTSVLGRLSGRLCDHLLERVGSERLLTEIERRQIFVTRLEDGSYRCHEILRGFLDEMLVEELGEDAAKAAHRRAAQVLERFGAIPEAVRAYGRAEEWREAARLLGGHGREVVEGSTDWLEVLPTPLAQQSPWLLLAGARRHVRSGRLQEACDAYRQAEGAFGAESAADICRQERHAVTGWLDTTSVPVPDWSGVVRRATAQNPRRALGDARQLPGPTGRLAAGLCALLAGEIGEAHSQLMAAALDDGSSGILAAGARVAALVASFLAGRRDEEDEEDVRWALQAAEEAGLTWLAQIGHALVVPVPDACCGLAHVGDACAAAGNEWGTALARLLAGLIGLYAGNDDRAPLAEATQRFHRLGAGVLAAWAEAGLAVASTRASTPDAYDQAARADHAGRTAGVPGASVLARVALAESDSLCQRAEHRSQAWAMADGLGLSLAGLASTEAPTEASPPPDGPEGHPAVEVKCFGRFEIWVNGGEIDTGEVKPRARSLLRLLASHAGQAVHREVLVDALWPDVDLASGVRGLQVAISSLRQLLEPGVTRGQSSLLRRDGDAYRLTLPAEDAVDVTIFDHAVAAGRRAHAAGRVDDAIDAYETVLRLYRGELLVEEGPAEWVVKPRARYRMEAAEAAEGLAALRSSRGDLAGAITACKQGLSIDRYRDGTWRLLIRTYHAAGDRAAAGRTELEYGEMLRELGVEDAS